MCTISPSAQRCGIGFPAFALFITLCINGLSSFFKVSQSSAGMPSSPSAFYRLVLVLRWGFLSVCSSRHLEIFGSFSSVFRRVDSCRIYSRCSGIWRPCMRCSCKVPLVQISVGMYIIVGFLGVLVLEFCCHIFAPSSHPFMFSICRYSVEVSPDGCFVLGRRFAIAFRNPHAGIEFPSPGAFCMRSASFSSFLLSIVVVWRLFGVAF